MQIKFVDEQKLKKDIKETIKAVLKNDFEIFLFGSRITGSSSDKSDIDIGIKGKRELTGSELYNIKDALDKLPYLFKFDVVDFSQTSKNFEKEALTKIEVL